MNVYQINYRRTNGEKDMLGILCEEPDVRLLRALARDNFPEDVDEAGIPTVRFTVLEYDPNDGLDPSDPWDQYKGW